MEEAPSRGVEGWLKRVRDKYRKLSSILRERADFWDCTSLSLEEGEEVRAVVMVGESRPSPKGVVADAEDPMGRVRLWAPDLEVVPGEVVGVKGKMLGRGTVAVEEVVRPDVPQRGTGRAEARVAVASDLHVGNRFDGKAWRRFCDWLRETRPPLLVLAGDLVDGVGVYPHQERELEVFTLEEQYSLLGEHLSLVPEGVEVLLVPGNHDAVPPFLPQPPLPRWASGGYPSASNPCLVEVDGVKIWVAHGQGFDDFLSARLTLNFPVRLMEELLVRRHFAPVMGGKTPVLPAEEDGLVISPPPDVLVCGHAHVAGVGRRKGRLMVNPGTFQGITPFMERMGVGVTTGTVALIDLEKMEAEVRKV